VIVAHAPNELERRPRSVAIGTFDGVHAGHRAVIEAAVGLAAARETSELVSTVLTFHPHPREVLGYDVELLSSLERRLELIAGLGVEETLVVDFSPELAALAPEEFVESYLLGIGAEALCAGEEFRFGKWRSGDLSLCERLGLATHVVPTVPGVSSTRIRQLAADGDVRGAAAMLGRPVEVEGIVVSGDARGGTLGFPTANLRIERSLLVPAHGIYAGAALDHRAAISIGVNPHYGGAERRIEAFLLDFEGDLYGQLVVVELWERLRAEAVFDSEADLVAQIARDVDATRGAIRP
jgi:riboflavin kinase / FMN adenylyltransferase